ncbi:LAQU0S04e03928g1_1 [Lachancea quebecensis]|uniref:LAQU0S04e03928g1_1 n=1 Tax=Lachancea quebecensis TaxID=1654605 RepID=A0A0P1KPX3_9SACH|nr:LAQU0S04e03928g1_1 [Lachancea quebecensis]
MRRTGFRRAVVFFGFALVCFLIARTSRKQRGFSRASLEQFVTFCRESSQRAALKDSPFSDFSRPWWRLSLARKDWREFKSQTLQEKCRHYFDTVYSKDSQWTNDAVRIFFNDEDVDNAKISNIVERVRVFDDCFISGGLSLDQVIPQKRDVMGFHHRMFPFLKDFRKPEELWPTIIDLNTRRELRKGIIPHYSAHSSDAFKMDNSKSFWYNWNAFSTGRGLVFSLGERHLDPFIRLLKVLDRLGNKLPIQIVQRDNELSEQFLNALSSFLQKSHQKVYFVNCGAFLESLYEAQMTFFVNKWTASIFNTFSEAILMDADVIPFIPPEEFFDDEQFSRSGLMLYKDRDMPQETTFDYCIRAFHHLMPSAEATILMNHTMKVNGSVVQQDTTIFSNEEERIYHRFFYNKTLHNVDSGLVVLRKPEKLSGLLISLFMNLDPRLSRCIYGDKELFWLGQLFSGRDYTIDPIDGSVVGSLVTKQLEDVGKKQYEICATQMSHSSQDNRLLWTNGGLKKCKTPGAAHMDFEQSPSYFESRYSSEEDLQEIYDQALSLEALIVPDIKIHPWVKVRECLEYTYCASLSTEDTQSIVSNGAIVIFDERSSRDFNNISSVWNQKLDL